MSFWKEMYQSRKAFLVFIPLMMLYATSYFQRTALPGTIFNELQRDCAMNALQVANIGASFVYVYAVCQLFSGMFADKYCGSRVVALGGLIFIAGIILFPLAANHYLLYFARMLTGLGASTMYLSLVKETDRLFDRKNYPIMIAVVYFFGYGGGLCGSLPFERLCSLLPWRSVLMGAAIVSAVCYLLFLWGKSRITMPPPAPVKISFKPLFSIMRNPLSWLILFVSSVNFTVFFIIQTVFGKKFLQDFAGMSSVSAAAVVFSLTFCCMLTILSAGIVSRLCNNRHKPLIIAASGLSLTSSLAMLAGIYYHLPAPLFVVCYLLYAMSAGVPMVFAMAIQEVNSRDTLTQSTAFCNMANYLFVAIVSQLAGLLLESIGGTRDAVSGAMIYSDRAYLVLYLIVSTVSLISFCCTFLIPETRGHYLHLTRPELKKINFSRTAKIITAVLSVIIAAAIASFTLFYKVNDMMEKRYSGKIFEKTENVPVYETALLMGAAEYTRSGRANLYFHNRIDAALELYRTGRVKQIIISGDNSRKNYNEPADMKKALIAGGIPAEALTLDYAGFRTLDSVARAKNLFGKDKILIITQKYHAFRALYLAEKYNIEAAAFAAADVNYRAVKTKNHFREKLARVKAVLDINVFKTKPKFEK